MELERIDRALEGVFRERRWILVTDAAAGATMTVTKISEWGAEDVMVVSAVEGVGELPVGVPIHYTRTSGNTVMEGIRAFFRSLQDPSPELVADLDRFDPGQRALALAPPFGRDGAFAGRRVYGSRRPEWTALEDKMIVDELWDRAGVPHAPCEVVNVADAADAHTRLTGTLGTVWVADNSTGWHGAGEYVRWVRDGDMVGDMLHWFESRAERVRVMPFLDGIPCSIHGYVSMSGIAAFRPVEMLIARVVDPPGFHYLGYATTWDPPRRLRQEMQTAARSVARLLADTVGYLGPFSIDGVATVDGFRPTELNPRLSAGFGIQASTVADLPVGIMTRALIEGDLEVDAGWLESTIVEAADASRIARMGLPVLSEVKPDSVKVAVEAGRLRVAGEGDGTLEVGASPSGSFVRFTLEASVLPAGASFAPYAVAAARLASDHWGFDLPDLEPACDVVG